MNERGGLELCPGQGCGGVVFPAPAKLELVSPLQQRCEPRHLHLRKPLTLEPYTGKPKDVAGGQAGNRWAPGQYLPSSHPSQMPSIA